MSKMVVFLRIFNYFIVSISVLAYLLYCTTTPYEAGFKDDDNGNLIRTLPYEVSGNLNSSIVLVFLHGFPNTMRMWDEMIENFKNDYICINISYPNYSEKLKLNWGMDLTDIAFYVKTTVEIAEKDIKEKSDFEKKNFKYSRLFVSHDWGAYLTYMIDDMYKEFINEIVTFDVGAGIEKTVKAKMFSISYQWYLAGSFLLRRNIGDYLTNLFLNLIPKPIYGISDNEFMKINSSYNFFYYQFWKRFIYYYDFSRNYKTETAVSFFYGRDKLIMFHNDEFIDMIKTNKNSQVFELDGHHWFMEKDQNMKLILDVIRKISKRY